MGQALWCYDCCWFAQCHCTGFSIGLKCCGCWCCCVPNQINSFRENQNIQGAPHGCGYTCGCLGCYICVPEWLMQYSVRQSIGDKRYTFEDIQIVPRGGGASGQNFYQSWLLIIRYFLIFKQYDYKHSSSNKTTLGQNQINQTRLMISKTPGTWKQGFAVIVGCQVKYLVGWELLTSILNKFILNCWAGSPLPIISKPILSEACHPPSTTFPTYCAIPQSLYSVPSLLQVPVGLVISAKNNCDLGLI